MGFQHNKRNGFWLLLCSTAKILFKNQKQRPLHLLLRWLLPSTLEVELVTIPWLQHFHYCEIWDRWSQRERMPCQRLLLSESFTSHNAHILKLETNMLNNGYTWQRNTDSVWKWKSLLTPGSERLRSNTGFISQSLYVHRHKHFYLMTRDWSYIVMSLLCCTMKNQKCCHTVKIQFFCYNVKTEEDWPVWLPLCWYKKTSKILNLNLTLISKTLTEDILEWLTIPVTIFCYKLTYITFPF